MEEYKRCVCWRHKRGWINLLKVDIERAKERREREAEEGKLY
jgi:hypothetical protein